MLALRSPLRTALRDPEAMATVLSDILLGVMATMGLHTLTALGSLPNGWWRAHQRPATSGSLSSEVGVEGVLHIDGEDAQAQRMGHFAKQLHRSTWIGLSGIERRALLLTDYDPGPGAFRCPYEPPHGPSAWNTAPPVRTARSIAGGEGA